MGLGPGSRGSSWCLQEQLAGAGGQSPLCVALAPGPDSILPLSPPEDRLTFESRVLLS